MKFSFASNLQKVWIYARADLNYPDGFLHISCLLTIEIWMCFQIQISTVRIGKPAWKYERAWNFTNNGAQTRNIARACIFLIMLGDIWKTFHNFHCSKENIVFAFNGQCIYFFFSFEMFSPKEKGFHLEK